MSENRYIDALKGVTKNIGLILGFRQNYRIEIMLTILGIVSFVGGYLIWGNSLPTISISTIIFITPSILQYYNWRRRVKLVPKENKYKIPLPTVPLFTIITTGILSAISPPLIIAALINILFIEDVTVFFEQVDTVKLKRDLKIIIEPITKRDLAVLSFSSLFTAVISYLVVRNPLIFIYPIISYVLIAYSLIFVPRDVRGELGRRRSLMEELSRRVPFLYYIFRLYYMRRDVIRLGKQAGYIGSSYFDFIRKTAGIFTFSVYITLALTPLIYLVSKPFGLDLIAFLSPVIVGAVAFFLPFVTLRTKRNARAGKISRNLMLILSYFASMMSVAESFTNAMENLIYNKNLAKMFGLEEESNIYMNIYRTWNDEQLAMNEYAETVPDDFLRDTIRTMKDIQENEGYGAVFKSITTRLKDYITRNVDKMMLTYENIGSNIISVTILVETTIPILVFLSNPMMVPLFMLLGGILSAILISIISLSVLPDLPSEYTHVKPRYKKGGIVFAIVAPLLTILEYFLIPQYMNMLILLNIVATLPLVLYYVSLEDISINKDFLNKFPDLLILFSSSMIRFNNAEKALMDLSTQVAFTPRMRRIFTQLANVYAVVNIERLTYNGPYWYKYFIFLSSIAAKYGTTPRELYKTISEFMLEYKKFFAAIEGFGRTIVFMTIVSLFIMTLEVQIVINFTTALSQMKLSKMTAQLGVRSILPELTSSQIVTLKLYSYITLLIVAILNGLSVGKNTSGTFRDAKWAFILYVIEIILIYLGITTAFGIKFNMGT